MKFDSKLFMESLEGAAIHELETVDIADIGEDAAQLSLPWTVTVDYLEGEGSKERWTKLAGKLAAKDLDELITNGDQDSDDPLLKALDGTLKRAKNGNPTLSVPRIAFEGFTSDRTDTNVVCSIKLRLSLG